MPLRPFRIPETRLIVISDLVVQVTLTFRTDEDEEIKYRYEQDAEFQALVQTAVISLVNCGYTNGLAKGPGFVLHQMRKKWPIGRRYIFTHNGEPMQSSLHKYFFQLELIDELELPGSAGPILEISELRGVPMSPSASSYAGSTIEGLDAISLPPMSAIFGYGTPQQQQQHREQVSDVPSPTLSQNSVGHQNGQVSHRRGGSNSSFHRQPSPSPLRHSSDAASRMNYYSADSGSASQTSLHGGASLYESRRSMHEARPSSASQYSQHHQRSPQSPRVQHPRTPSVSSVRTRSVSHSSAGSANGSVRTMQSQPEEPPRAPAGNEPATPSPVATPANTTQMRLGRTSWYRSLHGISPLSRQPKSISSSDNEFVAGRESAQDTVANIPRIARPDAHTRQMAAPAESAETGLTGIAHRLKRKLLTPINLRRARPRRSSLSREMPLLEVDSEVDMSDFTGPESAGASDKEVPEKAGNSSSWAAGQPGRVAASSGGPRSNGSAAGEKRPTDIQQPSTAAAPNIKRPDMPPPSMRPPRPVIKSRDDLASIPAAVKSALLRRLKSPLSGHPDKSSSRASVRDRIAAFNSLTMSKLDKPAAASQPGSPSVPTARTQGAATSGPNGGTHAQRPLPASPGSSHPSTPTGSKPAVRKRLGTATGFISVVTPVSAAGTRPQSRASSIYGGRPASPAMSQMSTGSSRVQEAISIFDSPGPATRQKATKPANGDRLTAGGVKRAGADPLEGVASPTKRPRAPSVSAHSAAGSDHSMASAASSSRLNPLGMVQRMIQRHSRR
ncbi:hypothetical protein GQ54DRAFT_153512 [Martensiomyces pterosporus]|nr:hypothetical protein GQ54DRAFT_153512 [Martensiomyces pterosporus]